MRNTMGKVEVILSDAMSLLIGGCRKRCQTLKFIDWVNIASDKVNLHSRIPRD